CASTFLTSPSAETTLGTMAFTRSCQVDLMVVLHGAPPELNQAWKQSLTSWEKCGSSLAPTATTTTATRCVLISSPSCPACEGSVYCLTSPSATCSAGAPEQAKLTFAVMPGTAVSKTAALGER